MTRNAIVISPHPLATGVLRRRGPGAGRGRGRGGRTRRRRPGGRRTVDPADRRADDRRAHRRDPRHRRGPASCAPPTVRQPRHRRRSRQRRRCSSTPPPTCSAPRDRLVASKAFDNSVLCTNESVADRRGAGRARLLQEMQQAGAHLLRRRTSATWSRPPLPRRPPQHSPSSARTRARSRPRPGCGSRRATRVLARAVRARRRRGAARAREDVPRARRRRRAPNAARGDRGRPAVLRIGGAGHSAAIHSTDPDTVFAFAAAVACCGWSSTRRTAPASPASTRTWRRR